MEQRQRLRHTAGELGRLVGGDNDGTQEAWLRVQGCLGEAQTLDPSEGRNQEAGPGLAVAESSGAIGLSTLPRGLCPGFCPVPLA